MTTSTAPSSPSPAGQRGAGFAELFRAVRRAGLLEHRRRHYGVRIALTGGLLAAAAAGFVILGDSWWQLLTAVIFAVLFTQFGFTGHDAGHRQIFTSKRGNDLVGYLHGNLLIGLSYGWWMGKHNAHHANPNHEDRDPDVQLDALAFTAGQSRGRRGLQGFVTRHQAALFFPLLLLEGLELHVSSVRAIVSGQVDKPRLETLLLLVHAVTYLGAIFAVLSPLKALVFIAVQQGLFGLYLGCSFAPNHKGMPMLTAADEVDPVRKQVLTSRNVYGGRLIDAALGGLNYQIEHHLFPRMPRPNLRHAQPLVRQFCRDHGIAYVECSLLSSYAQTLRHLHAVSAPLRCP